MNIYTNRPLLRVLSGTVTGIFIAGIFPTFFSYFMSMAMLAWVLLLSLPYANHRFLFRRRIRIGIIVHLGIVMSIAALVTAKETLKKAELEHNRLITEKHMLALAVVSDLPPRNKEWGMCQMQVISIRNKEEWVTANSLVQAIMQRKGNIVWSPGDLILIHGQFLETEVPKNPGEFDYRSYLARRGVYHRVFLDSTHYRLVGKAYDKGINPMVANIRLSLKNLLSSVGVEESSQGFLMALLLGDKAMLNKEDRSNYAAAGIMHVMAVSGLHVGTLYFILNVLLAMLDKSQFGKTLRILLIVISLWLYGFVTGLAPSVLRAIILLTLILWGKGMKERSDVFNLLAASAIIILLYDHSMLSDVGFQLSFAAVTGILVIYPLLYRIMVFRRNYADKIWSFLCVSLAAQLGTFPLGIFYFNQFPTYFLLANLLIVPLALLIFYTGISIIAVQWFEPVCRMLAFLLNHMVKLLNGMAAFVHELPVSMISDLYLAPVGVGLLYGFIFLLVVYCYDQKRLYIYTSLMCFVFFWVERLHWTIGNGYRKSIVFYAVKDHVAVDYIEGHSHWLISDPNLSDFPERVDMYLQKYWIGRGINRHHFLSIKDDLLDREDQYDQVYVRLSAGNILMRLGEKKKIMILKEPIDPEKHSCHQLALDYLVLEGNLPHNIAVLRKHFRYKKLIIGLSNQPYRAEQWVATCQASGINYHDMAQDGALLIDL